MTNDLTPAEQAAAEALRSAIVLDDKPLSRPELDSAARAVVSAVRPLIEADALDAIADVATTHGPPTLDQLLGLAYLARRGRTVRDWLTEHDQETR